MKRKTILLVSIIFFFITGCTSNFVVSSAKENWLAFKQSFVNKKWNGVAELNYKQLALRNDVVARTYKNQFRIDFLAGGVLGFLPSPIASIFFDENKLQFRLMKPQKKTFSGSWKEAETEFDFTFPAWLFQTKSKQIKQIEKALLTKKIFENEAYKITLNEMMQIQSIVLYNKNEIVEITLKYRNNNIDELHLKHGEDFALHITIDKISNYERKVPQIFKNL